jgi:hypothetical protein
MTLTRKPAAVAALVAAALFGRGAGTASERSPSSSSAEAMAAKRGPARVAALVPSVTSTGDAPDEVTERRVWGYRLPVGGHALWARGADVKDVNRRPRRWLPASGVGPCSVGV